MPCSACARRRAKIKHYWNLARDRAKRAAGLRAARANSSNHSADGINESLGEQQRDAGSGSDAVG